MENDRKRKIKFLIFGALFAFILFFSGIKINNRLEWEMAVDAAGPYPMQLGIMNTLVTPCVPVFSPAGVAVSCMAAGGGGLMCPQFVPGQNGTYETGCPLFSEVSGQPSGGMGNMALLSNVAISQAGLAPGGQFIYGGTVNNMSLMAPGAPNAILASFGGCYGCTTQLGFWGGLKEKAKYFIAAFKTGD